MLFEPRAKGLGKDSFLKLNDKEEVTGIFRGEIHTFKRHWVGNRSQECTGQNCPFCTAKIDPEKDKENYPAFRFRVNFVTTVNGEWVAKIFEGGGELYDQLTNFDRKFDLTKTVVEIARQGLKQNTKYHILPRIDQPITKEMEAKLKSVSLLALSVETVEEAVSA